MCGYCTAAKRLLDRKGVHYTEHDASFSPELRAGNDPRANGRTTFPQIFVGDVHVGGCDDLHALDQRAGSTGCWPAASRTEEATMAIFKAAAIQMRSGTDTGRNAATSRRWCARRPAKGATYVQTPGNDRRAGARQGSAPRCLHRGETATSSSSPRRGWRPSSASICMSARPRSCAPTASSPTARCCSGPTASVVAVYDKIHMFDVDLDNGESWRESAAYEPGTEAVVADLPIAQARLRHLLRRALPAAFPRRGAGRRRGADRARRLHAPDRRGALACAAARPRHRERRLRRSLPRKAACMRTAARPTAIR